MYPFSRTIFAIYLVAALLIIGGCSQEENQSRHNEPENITKTTEETETKRVEDTPPPTEEQEKVPNTLSELTVHYMDVGQADSTLLQYTDEGEEYTILIDAGNWNRNDVIHYLQAQHISEIDIAIGTHPDADHIGQLGKVINTFNVGEIWLSGNTSTSQTFQRLLQAIDQNNVDYYEPRRGDEFEVGPLQIEILYPISVSENDNEESISLKLTYGEISFIFTGDASRNDELKMINGSIDVDANILHLGHHGSSTSTHPAFLKEVSPEIAIYSAGKENSYGHPHKEVVDLIQDSNITLYGTDVHGTILVKTDGKNYEVLTKKDGTITPPSTGGGTSTRPELDKESQVTNGKCININTASVEELQEIIHLGPARAKELINLRPFTSIDELTRIKGIGPSRMEDIKAQNLACVGG
ncbi:MBL fold metallo-hydrolase [Fredinandcohnia onubensis]|uniref:MBL fold metallo-hydrolase n=1 Tax=Fredinandcohnia onubensis TaxID=1571209 RepID=UPI000C0C1030|nr:MBL fold metallo-hydrolase [Fredinandcohnia onubensis]